MLYKTGNWEKTVYHPFSIMDHLNDQSYSIFNHIHTLKPELAMMPKYSCKRKTFITLKESHSGVLSDGENIIFKP